MSSVANIIWSKGDGAMPEHAKRVVVSAQNELLLKSLQLPSGIIDMIRYNAEKNSQTVNDYISSIVIGHLTSAS